MKLQDRRYANSCATSAATPVVVACLAVAAAILVVGVPSVMATGGSDDQHVITQGAGVEDTSADAQLDSHGTTGSRPASETAGNGAAPRERASSASVASRTVPRRSDFEQNGAIGGRPSSLIPSGLGALAVVLGLVAVVYWVVRRWVPAVRVSDNGAIRVVGRAPLTPKHHVSVIQLGRRLVLVGVAPDRLTSLCEIRDPEEVADVLSRMERGRRGSAFDDQLFREAAAFSEPTEADDAQPQPSPSDNDREPLNALLSRLRRLQSKG